VIQKLDTFFMFCFEDEYCDDPVQYNTRLSLVQPLENIVVVESDFFVVVVAEQSCILFCFVLFCFVLFCFVCCDPGLTLSSQPTSIGQQLMQCPYPALRR
jgi:hypothetical protein